MKIIKNFSGDALWGIIPYIQKTLENLNDDNSEDIFFNGVEFIYDKNLRDSYKEYNRKVLFAHWSPCEFLGKKDYHFFDAYDFFTEVYCVCPFTCKFMNNYFGYEKFKYIPYPFTNYSVTEFGNYDSTCSWFGSIHGEEHIKSIELLSRHKYKFITSQLNTWMRHPYEFEKCTHVNLSTEDKLKEVSKCKSSLTFNKLYMNSTSINNHFYNGIENESFKYFNDGKMPQFKVRTHEIATCKSLILSHKDEWNLIEDFYEPNVDFIYFENFEELSEILIDLENNFEKYLPIIENAYTKVKNYSVENIFEYIKTQDDNLITWKNSHLSY